MKTTQLLGALFAATLPFALISAQDASKTESADQKQEQGCGMMEMKGMMGKDQMTSSLKEQGAELDRLVAEMNNAAPDKKLDAVVAVLTKLVEQRKLTHEQMQQMIQSGGSKGMCVCQVTSTDAESDHSQNH
jgi:hypothetical protein